MKSETTFLCNHKEYKENERVKIYIIRHAETVGNIEKRLTGREDYELSVNGKKTVEKLHDELKEVEFDKVYTSTSERTTKTVESLAIKNKIKIIKLEELCEMYFGIYDGWKWEKVNKINPHIKQNQIKTNMIEGIEKQETTIQTQNRMFDQIKKIAQNNKGKTILICSHGVAIEAFLRKIDDITFGEQRLEYQQKNCAINIVESIDGKFEIIRKADTQYIDSNKVWENNEKDRY